MPGNLSRLIVFVICLHTLGAGTALSETRQIPDSPPANAVSEDYMKAGAQSFSNGQYRQALANWGEAARLSEESGDFGGYARALLRRGAAYSALGWHTNAVQNLRQALEAAEKVNDPDLLASAMSNLGNIYLLLGQFEEARILLENGVNIAKQADAKETASIALNNLGNLFAARRQYEAAAAAFLDCLKTADQIGNRALAATASINLARIHLLSRGPLDAADYLNDALRRTRSLSPSHDKAFGLISLGRLFELSEPRDGRKPDANLLKAVEIYHDAGETARKINDDQALSYALGYLGQVYERAGRLEEALHLSRRAIQAAQKAETQASLYRWQWQTGRILKSLGQIEPAVGAYQRAVASLQGIRREMSSGYLLQGKSFREEIGPLYLELADLLLQRSSETTDPGQIQQYLREVRETVELLKSAELEDYFRDDCATSLRAKTAGIDRLASRTAAVYPIIMENRLEIIMSLPDGMKRFTSAVGADEFVAEVRTLRRRLEKRTTHQYLPHAKKIYNWLIAPLERELTLADIDTLVFVPDGALRTVPMAALHDGRGFLISRFALATTPGLTLTDPRPIPRDRTQLLLSGLTESVQGFPPLPNVTEELEGISRLYGGRVLLDDQFIIPNVQTELKKTPYSIVHIASHGQFDSDLDKTFLLTYDGKLSMDTLEEYMGMTRFRDNPVELLALSACQTAAGDDRAALGLAGIAVKAGARSALATLWSVSDRASALLVSEFYKQLQNPTRTKAQALRAAQMSLIEDRRYRHPGYWSPFLLIGNWL